MKFKSNLLFPSLNLLLTSLTLLLTSLTFSVIAQAPLQIPYQGVARDAQGAALQNQNITLLLAIEDISGTELFSETHSTTTNQFGLFNVKIGSVSAMPSNLWSNGDRFLHVRLDPTGGSVFTDLGTTQFLSVPYALYAETSNNPGPQGPAGLSAYEIWLSLGNEGNEQDFIASLTGPQGQCGNCDDSYEEEDEDEDDDEEDQSNTGSTGPQGPIGPQGPQGAQGIQGEVGPQGPAGNGIQNISINGNNLIFTLSDGSAQSITIPAPIGIGDYYQGGVIGYMLRPGDNGYETNIPHGLIYPSDWFYLSGQGQGVQIPFGCQGIEIPAYSNEIGSGQSNTTIILENCSELNTAAKFCDDFQVNEYNDWFLPSYDELREIILNVMNPNESWIGGSFWSYTLWIDDFNSGLVLDNGSAEFSSPYTSQYTTSRSSTFWYVLPIRKF